MFLTKKYIKKINKKAFTIIELSIVILVISVMVVGVVTGKSLIAKSRLANAKSLTRQSVINDMGDDLIAWYETSLEDSFIPSEIKSDGSKISMWKDSNKNAVNKNNATQTTDANKPALYQNVFYNSIPGLRFTNGQYLNFEGNRFSKNSYTVFVVEQRNSSKNENYFIASTSYTSNGGLHLGYRYDSTITQAHYSNDFDVSNPIPAYSASSPTPRIHTFLFNNSIGKQYTLNGRFTYTNSPAQLAPLNSFNSAKIGYYTSSGYYVGDLAEIIMFKRSLKTEEVEAIESYLGSKYGIPVS
jgi:prepilin-type N-terminal cleavage/methylation domain-containing protein